MPVKEIEIEDIGPVRFFKKRGVRSLRLSFDEDRIRVSLPSWVSYRVAEEFVNSKKDWIAKHRPIAQQPLKDGDKIGRQHTLRLVRTDEVQAPSAQLLGNTLLVEFPLDTEADDPETQRVIKTGALKALRKQASTYLRMRTRELAAEHGFEVASINIRQLKRRWGSCDRYKNVTYNIFLIQLPDELIDYVILHELAHTKHMDHQKGFWSLMESLSPNYKELRKSLKRYSSQLFT